MKILYLGTERGDAQAVATALRGLAEGGVVSWVPTVDQAAQWMGENPDLAAVIVDAQNGAGNWPSILALVRSLAPRPAVVVVVPLRAGPAIESVVAAADASISKDSAMFQDLPTVVGGAIARARESHQPVRHATTAPAGTQEGHQSALAAASRQLSDLQVKYDLAAARSAATWEMVDEQLRAAAVEVERARQGRASAAAEVDRLSQQLTALSSRLGESAAARQALERRLADAEAALETAAARAAQQRRAFAEQLAERQRELQAQLAEEVDKRRAVENRLADAARATADAESRSVAAAAQIHALQAALAGARDDLQSTAEDVERLTRREADLNSMLEAVTASHDDLEHRLSATQAAFEEADTRATRERLAASRKAAAREAELEGQIQQERAARAALEQAVADSEAVRLAAEERHAAALDAATHAVAERQAHFEEEHAKARAEADRLSEQLSEAEGDLEQLRREHQSATAAAARLSQREADLSTQLAEAAAARHTLERELTDANTAFKDAAARARELESELRQQQTIRATLEQAAANGEAALQDAQRRHEGALHEAARALAEQQARFESELSRVTADRDGLAQRLTDVEETLDELRREGSEAERSFREEVDVLRASARERQSLLEIELAKTRFEYESRITEMQHILDRRSSEHASALAAREREIERVEEARAAVVRELEAAKRSVSTLQTESRQLPRLQEDLAASRAESQRLFQQMGQAMFRCTRAGALTQANRACMTLIGRRTIEELQGPHFAAAVFDDPNALSWVIERCLRTRTKESLDATWRRKDGGRLFVRLSAYASSSDAIEIGVEDLTRLRVLEERLAQAHRMEAVGRLASDVAITCAGLLDDVHRNVGEWLKVAGGEVGRHQGERVLAEVTRAAGLLGRLTGYGDEQARTPALADLSTVVKDLQPVLKRVAGNRVEVQLRDSSSPLNVDVGTERVERLLVNLASYGRERMPAGGQLRIELGTTVVDRHFAAKHPNVRLGQHALITLTKIRCDAASADPILPDDGASPDGPQGKVNQKAAVDLGTLHGLVAECGGHLWMTLQPLGDMVAKIRLPLLAPAAQPAPRALALRGGGRERTLTRWLQH